MQLDTKRKENWDVINKKLKNIKICLLLLKYLNKDILKL
jgi:hypothetical protein